MNYLAHFWLAGPRVTDRVGGLLGDFVKGPLPCGLPPDLAAGVALHRKIDVYADEHPAFIASRRRFSPLRRRYAGIIVDLFYDHILARDWPRYQGGPLADATAVYYAEVRQYQTWLPERLQRLLPRMQTEDWLASYARLDAVGTALDNLSRYRLRGGNPLLGAMEELVQHYGALSQDAAEFLPAARTYVTQSLAERDIMAWQQQRDR